MAALFANILFLELFIVVFVGSMVQMVNAWDDFDFANFCGWTCIALGIASLPALAWL